MTPGRHNDENSAKNNDTNNEFTDDPANMALNSGAYVLNTLDQAERSAFEAYLAESTTIRDEVTELTDVAVLLGLAVEPVQPSPQLKSNIMSMLASTPQLSRDIPPVRTLQAPTGVQTPVVNPSYVGGDSDAAGDAPVTPAQTTPSPSSRKTQARWFNRPMLALTAVAAAIALIVGGGAIANVLGQTSFQEQQADQLAAITSADDMQQEVAKVSTGGTATVVWSAELGKSAVILDGMAALPGDKTYQLWYMDEAGAPTRAGLFDVTGSEREWRVLDGNIGSGTVVGVTVEPRGGSDAPTTAPIFAVNVA